MPVLPQAMKDKLALGGWLRHGAGGWPADGGASQPEARGFASGCAGRAYGVAGSLEVRLARSKSEVRAAQRLRYQVFFEEMSARPTRRSRLLRRDEDGFDRLCDHLLVVDRNLDRAGRTADAAGPRGQVVGTYRLLRQDVALRHGGFYSAAEYDLAPLLARKAERRFVEVGRSCVRQSHRSKRTLELLWHGLWTYVRENRFDAMLGCASFPGVDPDVHANALSFLHATTPAPLDWHVRAHPARYVAMNRSPAGASDAKAVLKTMPPLIKGYLRLGAHFGDGAVIDRQFGTTDVLVVLPIERIDPRYFARFGAPHEVTSRIGPAEPIMAH